MDGLFIIYRQETRDIDVAQQNLGFTAQFSQYRSGCEYSDEWGYLDLVGQVTEEPMDARSRLKVWFLNLSNL